MVKSCGPGAAILMQLRSSEIYSREDTIKPPTEGTASWPIPETVNNYEELSERSNDRANLFTPWLRSGSGVFHISGKAGSGKSTLMKHIWLHHRTQEHLEVWAGNKKLLKAAFFFWSAGNEDQKSLTGLFRSILFTILSQDKNLIPQIFPQCWENGNFVAHSLASLTRPDVIEAAFQTLLGKAANGDYRICLFIDGLDEFEAADRESYWELARRLGDWADRSDGDVKLCVSSRPYTEFQDIFRASQSPSRTQIHLHQLNGDDIKRYCQNTFSSKARESPSISKIVQGHGGYLGDNIVYRSEGVFLWAVLVVRIIISEARRGGSYEDLLSKLEETPSDMDKLYDKMFSSLGRSEKGLSTRLLFAVLTNPFFEMNALCLKWLVSEDAWRTRMPQNNGSDVRKAVEADIKYVARHLDIWTQGLVEIVQLETVYPFHRAPYNVPYSPLFVTKVKLFHRTARDYLLHSMQYSEVQSAFEGFNLEGLHSHLRLTEVIIIDRIFTSAPDNSLLLYGYEILTAISYARLGSIEKRTGVSQLPWSVAKELVCILPSCYLWPTFRGMIGYTMLIPDSIHRASHTSLPRFAFSLGFNQFNTAESSIDKESDWMSSSSNLLLSACLSDMCFRRCPLIGKVTASELVKVLLQKGFTAHQPVALLHSDRVMGGEWEWELDDRFASVWMILVSSLVVLDEQYPPIDSLREIVNVLQELLRHESQEEVLILGYNSPRPLACYDCFITFEDLLQRLGSHVLNKLQGPLKGEENESAWIRERWNGQTIYPVSQHLVKLTPEMLGERKVILSAVVSRTYFLEEGIEHDIGNPPCFMLW
ncbi:hypothetical protein RRF57_012771 [Xylaria bambusicola]|uniref:Nephrocystin 3-like N-terminal domain-containing protein n=1 Tax=Xylaria bambusicola TaxID=326684 RepID=A0AAN7UYH1_9PEZI